MYLDILTAVTFLLSCPIMETNLTHQDAQETISICASTRDFGTYHIVKLRMLRFWYLSHMR